MVLWSLHQLQKNWAIPTWCTQEVVLPQKDMQILPPGTVEIGRIVSLEVEAFVSFSASGLLQGIDSPDEVSKSFGIRKAMADQSLLCPHPEPSQTVKKHGRQEAEEWECTLGYGRRKRIRPGNVIKIWINLVVFINYDIGRTNLDRYSLFIILIHVCFCFVKYEQYWMFNLCLDLVNYIFFHVFGIGK